LRITDYLKVTNNGRARIEKAEPHERPPRSAIRCADSKADVREAARTAPSVEDAYRTPPKVSAGLANGEVNTEEKV